jgi:hypothetical protein
MGEHSVATMFHASIPDFFAASPIFFVAGAVKGVLGMGLPTVGMGLLGLVMPVTQAAVLMGVPSLATNAVQAWRGPRLLVLWRRLWPLQLGVALGVASGWGLMDPSYARVASLSLGACLVVYGVTGWAGLRLPAPAPSGTAAVGAIVGWLTGVVTAATGVFVLPAVPFLQSLRLAKDEMAQALGLSFLTSTLALAALLAFSGQLRPHGLLQSTLMLAPALAGMWLGQQLRDEMSEAGFRRVFFCALTALGLWIVARQVLG